MSDSEPLTFDAGGGQIVSALLDRPGNARAVVVLAHGAGGGMRHPLMGAIAHAFADRGVATLRYQFPYSEAGRRRVDPPAIAHATVRAAIAEAARRIPGLPVFAGGKSYGGRMTSPAAALMPLAGVRGIVFLGFPLHPPGKPDAADERGAHLSGVTGPTLFRQGTHDEFADLDLLKPLAKRLGKRARLHLIADANHSFKVPAKSGRKDGDVRGELADVTAGWIDEILGAA